MQKPTPIDKNLNLKELTFTDSSFDDYTSLKENQNFLGLSKDENIEFKSVNEFNNSGQEISFINNLLENPNITDNYLLLSEKSLYETQKFPSDSLETNFLDSTNDQSLIFNTQQEFENNPSSEFLLAGNEKMKPEDKVIDNDQKPYLMKYAVSAADAYCDPSAIQLSENIFVVWDLQEHGIIIKFRANETKLGEYMYRKTELIDYEHNYPGAKVHAALYKEFREKAGSKFLEQIMPLIKVNDDLFRTYLVGHSLGGAYAQFAALLLVDKFPEMIQPDVYTYGSPRIGNMAFARYAKSQIHLLRVTISNDEIPRYPVRNHLIFGFTGNIYEHSGVEYWIEEPGGPNIIVYRCTPQERSYESKSCVNKMEYSVIKYHNGPYFNMMMNTCEGWTKKLH